MPASRRLRFPLLLLTLFASALAPVDAQSPHTATMIVAVTDQTGAAVKDAKVSIVNNATGAARDALSANDGSATFPALSKFGRGASRRELPRGVILPRSPDILLRQLPLVMPVQHVNNA